MSGEAIGWAFRKVQMDDPTAKLVLVAMCNYANANDEAWPSHASVAAVTGLSKRAVQNSIKKLEDWGIIVRARQSRDNGSETSAVVSVDLESSWVVKDGVASRAMGVAAGASQVSQEVPRGVAGGAILETTLNPQKETTDSELPLGSPAVKGRKGPSPKHSIAENAQISPYQISHAAQSGFSEAKARDLFTRFKNHHQMKGNKFANWDAAWRMWISNEIKFSKPDPNTRPDDRGVLM